MDGPSRREVEIPGLGVGVDPAGGISILIWPRNHSLLHTIISPAAISLLGVLEDVPRTGEMEYSGRQVVAGFEYPSRGESDLLDKLA